MSHGRERPPYEAVDTFVVQGRWDLAEQTIRRALMRWPEDAWLLGHLALCQINQGQAEESQQTLLTALVHDADMAWLYYLLGKVILTTGRARKAEGRRPWWRWLLPETAGERALADAEDAYHSALALDPHLVDAYAALSELKRLTGDLAAAEEFAAKGLSLNPEHVDCLLELSQAHRFRGRHEQAEKLERQVLQVDPNAALSFVSLGRSQLSTGHLAGAERALASAMQLNPDLREARSLLRDVQARLAFSPYAMAARIVDQFKNPRYRKVLSIVGMIVTGVLVLCLYLFIRWVIRPRFGEKIGDATPVRLIAIVAGLGIFVWLVFLMFRLAGEIMATLCPRSATPRPLAHRFAAISGLVVLAYVAVMVVVGLVTRAEFVRDLAISTLPLTSFVIVQLFVPFTRWNARLWWLAAGTLASSGLAVALTTLNWWDTAYVVLGLAYVGGVAVLTTARDLLEISAGP